MKQAIIICIMACMGLLSGCATIVNGRFQDVTVNTTPPGSTCILTNNKGQWVANNTPVVVNIHRSVDDLHVSCQKPGYAKTTEIVKSDVKKMAAGNIVFGGVLGAGVDTINGAAFSYPSMITVGLNSSKTS